MNELLTAAKNKAAQEWGYELFDDAYDDSDIDKIINRAMEIYASQQRTEGIKEGFEAARLPLIQEGRNCGDLYPTVDDYLNKGK